MIEKVQIETLRCLRGASAGLPQKTALATLQVRGHATDWLSNRQPSTELLSEVLPVQIDDWNPNSPDTFAGWVVALTVAILREAREPVSEGTVIADTGERIVLALPYCRENVAREALRWTLRYLIHRTDPSNASEQNRQLLDTYRRWLDRAQSRGLAPNTFKFGLAAMARGWPVRVDGATLFIGWGTGQYQLDSSFTGETSHLAARIARNKHKTSQRLSVMTH